VFRKGADAERGNRRRIYEKGKRNVEPQKRGEKHETAKKAKTKQLVVRGARVVR